MFSNRRKSGNTTLWDLISIASDIRMGKRGILRVKHYKNTYATQVCYLDYKEELVFVFSNSLSRLLTVRDDLKHFIKLDNNNKENV